MSAVVSMSNMVETGLAFIDVQSHCLMVTSHIFMVKSEVKSPCLMLTSMMFYCLCGHVCLKQTVNSLNLCSSIHPSTFSMVLDSCVNPVSVYISWLNQNLWKKVKSACFIANPQVFKGPLVPAPAFARSAGEKRAFSQPTVLEIQAMEPADQMCLGKIRRENNQ